MHIVANELIADMRNGHDVLGHTWLKLDFLAQVANVCLDQRTIAGVIVAPYPLQDHMWCYDLSTVRQEKVEQAALDGCQTDRKITTTDFVAYGVQRDGSHGDARRCG